MLLLIGDFEKKKKVYFRPIHERAPAYIYFINKKNVMPKTETILISHQN